MRDTGHEIRISDAGVGKHNTKHDIGTRNTKHGTPNTKHFMYKRNLVFAAACMGMLLFGISLVTLGSVAADLRSKFNLDEISSGTLFSILPVGVLIGSLLFGPVCDKYGYKVLMIVACAGMFVGFEGIAFTTSLVLMKICIFIFGLGGGIINGATNAAVADISTEGKGANLSLLGVFYGIGALGMPFILGSLKNNFSFDKVVTAVGLLTLAVGLFYGFIKFPPSKKAQGFPLVKSGSLFKDALLTLIAFFLFCQSSFEAILNNWTTTYLTTKLQIEESSALYALSLYLAGMTLMRFVTGTIFRSVTPARMMTISLIIILVGILFLKFAESLPFAVVGLILLGVGLAAGFPIMLGIVGNLYAERSGSAFSFALVTALTGNMLVNYLMGLIAQKYSIYQLTTVAFVELAAMIGLCLFIFRKVNLSRES